MGDRKVFTNSGLLLPSPITPAVAKGRSDAQSRTPVDSAVYDIELVIADQTLVPNHPRCYTIPYAVRPEVICTLRAKGWTVDDFKDGSKNVHVVYW